jgi:hyperosmotically inducible periplasmic protein
MKTAFIFFLLGACAVLAFVYLYHPTEPVGAGATFSDKARTTADDVAARTRETAGRVKETVSEKLEDWHLTGDDIKADLAKSGEVVRSKAHVAGEKIADARIVTVIKAKYVLDRDLSALDIAVAVDSGEVMLTGSVVSADLIGRAIRLALETDGVLRVRSRLAISPAK